MCACALVVQCHRIHRTLASQFKYALVWVSADQHRQDVTSRAVDVNVVQPSARVSRGSWNLLFETKLLRHCNDVVLWGINQVNTDIGQSWNVFPIAFVKEPTYRFLS